MGFQTLNFLGKRFMKSWFYAVAIVFSSFCTSASAQTAVDIGSLSYVLNPALKQAAVLGRVTNNTDLDVSIPAAVVFNAETYDVVAVGEDAFLDAGLTSVNLPKSLTVIGEQAFYRNNLTEVVIPSSVRELKYRAFRANELLSVTIPEGVTTVGEQAFQGNPLAELTLSNTVTSIGDNAFYKTVLTSVVVPSSVTTIGNGAFAAVGVGQGTITSLTLGGGLQTIGEYAFESQNLTQLTIPSNVVYIGKYAFLDNDLAAISLGENLVEISEGAFAANVIAALVVPSAVTTIGKQAFASNTFTSLTIPGGVTTIGEEAFGDGAIKTVYFSGSASKDFTNDMFDGNPAILGEDGGIFACDGENWQSEIFRVNDTDVGVEVSNTACDTDGDGVADAEDQFPVAVTSAVSGAMSVDIALSDANSTCSLASFDTTPVDAVRQGVANAGIGFAAAFRLEGCNSDAAETVVVTLDLGVTPPVGSKAYKILTNGDWREVIGATLTGSNLTYALRDNGYLDLDPALGDIEDPVTVAVPSAKAVPVLPPWGLVFFTMLVAFCGLTLFRSQNA